MATKKVMVESRNYGKNSVSMDVEDFSKVKDSKLYLGIPGGCSNEPVVYCFVKGKRMLLHQFILGPTSKGKKVRYKNGNKLDVTRKNLIIL
jgi:hypothetical protein